MICIISAIAKNGVIGSKDGLPWSIPEEYNKFLNHVDGNTVIMGRVSWEIFGADLPNTRFIVVSSSLSESKGLKTVSSMDEAVKLAKTYPEPVFIAGGAQIYREGLKYADTMYLSFIRKSYPGDRFFPPFDESDWIVKKVEEHEKFIYKEYQRKL